MTTRALHDGRPYEIQFPVLTPDGRRRILRGRGVPVRGDSGTVERIHGFAQDVTELARAESQQRAAAALGQLALSGVTLDVLMREAAEAVTEELGLDFARRGRAPQRGRPARAPLAERPQHAGGRARSSSTTNR